MDWQTVVAGAVSGLMLAGAVIRLWLAKAMASLDTVPETTRQASEALAAVRAAHSRADAHNDRLAHLEAAAGVDASDADP